MKKSFYAFFAVLWVCALAALGGYYLLAGGPGGEFDARENRLLASAPSLEPSTVLNGGLSTAAEDYLSDHIPLRGAAIDLSSRLRDAASFAGYADSLAVLGRTDDALSSTELDADSLEAMADALLSATPAPTPSPAPTAAAEPPEAGAEEALEETEPPAPVSTPKPAPDPDAFPEYLDVRLEYDGTSYTAYSYGKYNVLALTSVLNRVAALLPEDGTLVYTMVPQSSVGNLFVNAEEKTAFVSEAEAMVEAYGAANVHAVCAADILAEAIREGEYVYFRSDMHWTPRGTYRVYREMARLAGVTPAEWEDFDLRVEEPFLGTYYRDNPSSYMAANPDTLELLSPKFPLEWRRLVHGEEEYKLLPFLNDDAAANDRYTVYLGGPAGPWTYAQCDNGKEDRCLVITDSFGLAFVPMVTQNYGQVHYYDPRYFNSYGAGGSVKELIANYGIKDVYVVVGDLHSYWSDFLIYQMADQLGDG